MKKLFILLLVITSCTPSKVITKTVTSKEVQYKDLHEPRNRYVE